MSHIIVVGGGILGLATAHELGVRGHQVTVCEKEARWAAHQTGHNSNVVHAGLYYRPGSLKARTAVVGNASMVRFAREHGVPVDVCGKLVVATDQAQLPRLAALARRAADNGVSVRQIGPAEARDYEPNVAAVAALRVDSTAVIDFPAVCACLAGLLESTGADLRLSCPVLGIHTDAFGRVKVATPTGVLRADALVNCAGLHADRVARLAGLRPTALIMPFRGEYFRLRPAAAHLVRGLVYPMPNPALPFLGVHLTRMLDGTVHAGPNAVLALARQGYRWSEISVRDLAEMARFPGLWRLAGRYPRTAVAEVVRSLSRRRFAASLATLVPALGVADIMRSPAGVRAQAVLSDGSLLDDFLIETTPRQVHVLNAQSPAATAALEIARQVADRLAARLE